MKEVINIDERLRSVNGKEIYCGGSSPFKYEDVKRYIEVETESGCELLSTVYVNSTTKMDIKCPCGETFVTSFGKFKQRNKRLCNDCALIKRSKLNSKTHEEFVKEMEFYAKDQYELLSIYKGDKEKIKVRHVVCDSIINITASGILAAIKKGNTGCRKCASEVASEARTATQEEVEQRIFELVGDEYKIQSTYKKSIESVIFYHSTCDRSFNMSPNSFFTGHRCPHCWNDIRGQNFIKTHETFLEEVKDRVGSEYKILGIYEKSNIKISMKHEKCGKDFLVFPTKFIQGTRCPYCNLSKGARFIPYFLDVFNLKYEVEQRFDGCKNKAKLPFDFFIQDKVLLEYDGDFHFVPARYSKNKELMLRKLKNTQKNDMIKNHYCIENNIPLIRIPCWEIENLSDILTNSLSYLNLIEKREDYSEEAGKRFVVDANWNHQEYIDGYQRAYWLEAKENHL